MGVAVGVARVDARSLDRDLGGGLGRVGGVGVDGALELVEGASDLRDHGVAGGEAERAVARVDRVVAGLLGQVDGLGAHCGSPRTGGVGGSVRVQLGCRIIRSEEHASELQSIISISYASICLQ